ncbi:MAG: FAD-dependent oxidoreductase [Candidatus Omnitrophica bacterium]|nr:FAD-dependent oxidoreductase [Candidatus Omnitrophota bacterium]
MEHYDLVVIGGGAGGLVAALGGARLGAKTALIEKRKLGGDCLHYGCVPSKTLIYSAKVHSLIRRADEFGVGPAQAQLDFKKVMQRMREVQARIGEHDAPENFEKQGIKVLFGEGHFEDSRTFSVDGKTLRAKRFVIATGSRPVILPIPGLKESGVLTNEMAIDTLKELPSSIAILGAGPIGMEFAQVFLRLGSKVTVIEKMGQILPREDKEIADTLEGILRKEGMQIVTCTEVKEVKRKGQKKTLEAICPLDKDHPGAGETFEVDEVMIAIGRAPNVEGLGLEAAGVAYTKKGITVDTKMRTSQKHIFSVGDVAGPYPFTHMAEHQGGVALSNAFFPFLGRKADYFAVPWVTYTDPELGRVGDTESEAKEKHGVISIYRFPFQSADRAIIEGEEGGLIKVICDKKGFILGAHVLGPNGGELLHEFTIAKKNRLKIGQLSSTIHAYPTLAQAVRKTADQYYTEKLFKGFLPKLARMLVRLAR